MAWTAKAEDYNVFIILGVPHHYIYIPLDIHLPIFHMTAPTKCSPCYIGQIAERLTDALPIQAPSLLSLKHERK